MNPHTPEDKYERLEAHENIHRIMGDLSQREETVLRLRYGIPDREIGKDPVNRVAAKLRKNIEELNERIILMREVIKGKNIVIRNLEAKVMAEPKEINASEYINHLRSKYCPYCRNKLNGERVVK